MAININEFMEIEGDINKSVDKAIRSIRKMKVIEVALERLKPSKDNFYQMTDIDELKENIKEFGLIEPIVAMETENDDYEIISGHRRCEAFRQLAEENEEYKKISCRIIAQIPELKKKILLVSANKQTRDKTDWEITIEINKMKEYLEAYKKDTGVKMSPRQKIGEMTGRSKTDIGRHITIYNKLSPEMMERYKQGDLKVTAAEYAAGFSMSVQNDIAEAIKGEITRAGIEEYVLSVKPQETKPQAIQLEPEKPTEEYSEADEEEEDEDKKETSKNEVYNRLLKKMEVCGYENLEPCEQCKIATACPNCCKTCSEPCNRQRGCRKEEVERERCKNIEVDDESHIAKFALFPKKSEIEENRETEEWKKEEIQRQIERQIECLEFVDEILSAEWRKVVGEEYENKAAWYIRQGAANYIRKILGEIQQEINDWKRKLD